MRRFLSSKRRGSSGAVALEYALIAPVFLYLLFGILEVSSVLFTAAVVDGAAQSAARLIRTGAAQTSGDSEGAFLTEMCDSLTNVYSCDDITTDVTTFASFSAVSIPAIKINGNGDLVYDDGDNDDDNDVLYTASYTPGGAGDISVVRVIYTWDFVTPLIGELMGGADSQMSLYTTVVFRNEPYE
ncbi:TadE/TadG family type IV pilus assembly protein [Magnetovibrio sp. PR-2]|uniref:TadE/TadG family type IV pilus assembly protein n=1 Tax=Magnetovibrio sp. PR-2 TaxID=3120356 RepID=UPI002FCE34AB